MTVFTDTFNRADTANGGGLGAIPGGGQTWVAVAGSWRILSNRASTSTGRSSSPVVVADFGTADVDASVDISSGGGDALYTRVVDASNWFRLRLRTWVVSTTTQNTTTEYQWEQRYRIGGQGNHNPGETTGTHTHSSPYAPVAYGWGGYSSPPSFPGTGSHTHGVYLPDGNGSWNPSHGHAHNASSGPTKTGSTRTVNNGSSTSSTTYRQIVLERCTNGSVTQLSTSSQTTGSITSIRLSAIGTALLGYYNGGGASVSATSSEHLTETRHGVGLGTSEYGGSALDNYTIDTFNNPPNAPTMTTPETGQPADRADDLLVAWNFSDPDAGETQSAYALRRTIDGVVRYWNVSGGTWDAAEAKNTTSFPEIYLSSPGWHESGDADVAISVRTWDSSDTAGAYAPDVAVTPTSFMGVYNGYAFLDKPIRSYNGAEFTNSTLKRWNGSAWELV
jgi:hypothetical protein